MLADTQYGQKSRLQTSNKNKIYNKLFNKIFMFAD